MTPRLLLPLVLLVLPLALGGCRDLGPGGHPKASEVVYAATGPGNAAVRYAPTGSRNLTPPKTVNLPWQHHTEVVDHSGTVFRVLVHAPDLSRVHCSITVNGVVVPAKVRRQGGVLECSFVK